MHHTSHFNPLAGITTWHFIGFLVVCVVVGAICAIAAETN